MKITHLAIGLGLLCFGGLANAADAPQSQPAANTEQTTSSSDQQAAATETAKEEKKVCKREPMTGSLLGAKVCKTQKEWDEQAKGNGADF